MTDSSVPGPSVLAPPFSEDLLADLHAGVLDPKTSETLWPLVEADPDALSFVRNLDNVTQVLRTRGDNVNHTSTDTDRIPPELAARIYAALDSEWAQRNSDSPNFTPNVVPLRRSRRGWAIGGAAAAAIAVVAVLIAVRPSQPEPDLTTQPIPTAQSTPSSSEDPTPDSFLSLIGSKKLGPLEDPTRLSECLLANGFPEDQPILGSGEVMIQGTPAVVLLLRGNEPLQISALAVGLDCRPGNPNLLSLNTIG
ncbi:hypothetical protein [Rhodococcus sp. IEGM 1379]|uniref:hypothetical protein n=1 Tax=Rhodococcus sp. IEGM 1379 TaxID=3047086 RepID=UPI0024B87559|nr:hypothetical protein [Rhodococcus sp. IEGM 1379]MDI9917868.1 hypothetical protein [Rhodococcus sp. IEGM 1379]